MKKKNKFGGFTQSKFRSYHKATAMKQCGTGKGHISRISGTEYRFQYIKLIFDKVAEAIPHVKDNVSNKWY